MRIRGIRGGGATSGDVDQAKCHCLTKVVRADVRAGERGDEKGQEIVCVMYAGITSQTPLCVVLME